MAKLSTSFTEKETRFTKKINVKEPVENVLPFIQKLIERRRKKWTLSTLEFDDAAQIILIRVWEKYDLFDASKGPLENWANTVITRAILNLLRDNLYKYIKPCNKQPRGCVYNRGGDLCAYTKSGKQCGECKLYRNWQKSKESQFNIQSSVTIENHSQEVSNMQGDFLDIDRAKKVVDEKIMKRLNPFEAELYNLLFIQHIPPQDVSKKMKYKIAKTLNGSTAEDNTTAYQVIITFQRKAKNLAKEIIADEDFN